MKIIYSLLAALFIVAITAIAQDQPSTNDIITKMKTDLNLSDDQVSNITQIIDRYAMASNDLQKSIEDGTMNPSAIDSQRQQIKAAEEQGMAQYLRSDQLTEWRQIEGQMDQQNGKDNGDSSAGADEYSNLPKNTPSQ